MTLMLCGSNTLSRGLAPLRKNGMIVPIERPFHTRPEKLLCSAPPHLLCALVGP
jgi:hypothetical protein